MIATRSDDLLEYLVTLFSGDAALLALGSDVNDPLRTTLVCEGPVRGQVSDPVIVQVGAIDDQAEQDNAIRFEQQWGQLGAGRRNEQIWVECSILVAAFTEARDARIKAYAVLDRIANLTNQSAAGFVQFIEVIAGAYTPSNVSAGFQGRMPFTVYAEAQLT